MKIEIKNTVGNVIFEHEDESNSVKNTIEAAVASNANLSRANISGAEIKWANLSWANLSRANLSGANLSEAYLSAANLSGADLSRAYLSRADLNGADLSEACLSAADLSGANLNGADLRRCIGNMTEIKSMQLDKWKIAFTKDVMAIGCQQHDIETWRNMSDFDIAQMDRGALEWWKKWKDFIFMAIDLVDTGV